MGDRSRDDPAAGVEAPQLPPRLGVEGVEPGIVSAEHEIASGCEQASRVAPWGWLHVFPPERAGCHRQRPHDRDRLAARNVGGVSPHVLHTRPIFRWNRVEQARSLHGRDIEEVGLR